MISSQWQGKALTDRYSNWLSILKLDKDTSNALIDALRNYFVTFGVPELLSTDGASIFTSYTFRDFCIRWAVKQRVSSAYHPRSNKRAELAVKHAKRLVQDSLGPNGSLETDSMARALLAHRNTPDSITGISPAQVVFGRVLRDFLPASPGRYQPRHEWQLTADQREVAHAKCHVKTNEILSALSRNLPALQVGDNVSVQDQSGSTPRRWSKTGKIVEILGHDSYTVKMDGSNRVTKRNRQFLRKILPYQCDLDEFETDLTVPASVPTQWTTAPDPLDDNVTMDSVPQTHPEDCLPNPLTMQSPISSPDATIMPHDDSTVQSDAENFDMVDSVDSQLPLVPPLKTGISGVSPLPSRPRVREKWVVNPKFVSGPDQV